VARQARRSVFVGVEETALVIDNRTDFERFVDAVERPLRRALVVRVGVGGANDATAAALAYAWEHWDQVRELQRPVAYLYRVGLTSTRTRKTGHLPAPAEVGLPNVEPALVPALQALPDAQRVAIWLVHACGWSYAEAAEAMGVSPSTIGTHLQRGLASLRRQLKVGSDD